MKVHCQDITQPNFEIKRAYDYIVMTDVLEHIPNPEDVLIKIKDNFNKCLIVSVPNTGFILDRLRLLFGRFPKQWLVHPGEHLRFWTFKDFISMCEQLGFCLKEYYGVEIESYEIKPKLWKWKPKLFSKDILYVIERSKGE